MNSIVEKFSTVWSASVFCFLVGMASLDCHAQYRSIDGTGNNIANPHFGAAETQLIRKSAGVIGNLGADYPGDQSGSTMYVPAANPEPLPSAVPNPRTISNMLFDQSGDLPSSYNLTSGVWQWGQFLDHDLDLTRGSAVAGMANIPIEQPDPDGMTMIPFTRSEFDPNTGTGIGNPRQQINAITSYIDASNVYGSDIARANALRTFTGGKLKTSLNGQLLPDDSDAALASLENDDGGTGESMFVAGDIRANEQIGLTAMHTLFVREHNRIADGLAGLGMNDEQIYQAARKVVGAEIQAITYNEFLPALLGSSAPSANAFVYDSTRNASIANEFSTAAFRFGHSMLNSDLVVMDPVTKDSTLMPLRDSFFNPQLVKDDPHLVEDVLMGLTRQQAQEIDARLVDDVRTFLFGFGGVGVDLAALNIHRGHDHGLPSYNVVREAYGLAPVTSFSEISPADAAVLQSIYGSVDNVDAWVGGLAESHLPGTTVGSLVAEVLIDQFTSLRDGDRFFYTGQDEMTYLQQSHIQSLVDVYSVTLADIIAMNTGMDIKDMPKGFFFMIPEPLSVTLFTLAFLGLSLLRVRRSL